MSIRSWQEEFYPIPVDESAAHGSDIEALNHSVVKWHGTRSSALMAHALDQMGSRLMDHSDGSRVKINSYNCALCYRYEDVCEVCPLVDCSEEFRQFSMLEDPEPMIELLEHKLVEAVMNEDTGIL